MDITMSDNKVYTVLVYSMTSLIDFSNTLDKNFLNEITVIKNNEQSKIMVVRLAVLKIAVKTSIYKPM